MKKTFWRFEFWESKYLPSAVWVFSYYFGKIHKHLQCITYTLQDCFSWETFVVLKIGMWILILIIFKFQYKGSNNCFTPLLQRNKSENTISQITNFCCYLMSLPKEFLMRKLLHLWIISVVFPKTKSYFLAAELDVGKLICGKSKAKHKPE